MTNTKQSDGPQRKRRGSNPRYAKPWANYTPFTPLPGEELDGAEAVRHHAKWVLANMDWFATQGRGLLASSSVALHRDLAHLGYVAPSPKTATELAELLRPPTAEEIAALVQPPSAMEVAGEIAKLHQRHGAVQGHLATAMQQLHEWFHMNDEVYHDPAAQRCYKLLRESIGRAMTGLASSHS